MTEEVVKPDGSPEPREAELTDQIEQIAADIGWNKDFEGDGAVDAKTYILRSKDINKTMAKKVKSLSRELDAMKEGISTIRSHYDSLREREVSKLTAEIANLKKERDLAAEDGDKDRYKLTNEKIEALEGEVQKTKEAPKQTGQAGPTPEYKEWIAENEWYEEDVDMRVWANNLASAPEYKAMPPKIFFKKITDAAKKNFPEKFGTPEHKEPKTAAAVAAPTAKTKKGKKATADDLNYHQKMIARDFVSNGVFKSEDEYAQALQEQGRI